MGTEVPRVFRNEVTIDFSGGASPTQKTGRVIIGGKILYAGG
jgi:hypothetical protein